MLVSRQMTASIREQCSKYPVLAITGPRQSGKTTLLRNLFPDYRYVSLEDPFQRNFALEDPRNFLKEYDHKVILDEVQRVPDLFSYLQTKTDLDQVMGQYILSGSQNFLLLEKITQSLAGRVALFTLLPFSRSELVANNPSLGSDSVEEAIYRGGYPPIYARTLDPGIFFADYLATYIERDVRNLLKVQDLSQFQNFIHLCAGRIGTPLNLQSLAIDCGISSPTAKAWLSLLEASYIIYLLPPFFENFNKRIIKSKKLYFYDTGLACSLLGLGSPAALRTYYQRGGLFENWVIAELLKNRYNRKNVPRFYFWQDSNGVEVDLLIAQNTDIDLFEMKYSHTPKSEFFKGLQSFRNTAPANRQEGKNYVLYAGDERQPRDFATIESWRKVPEL